MEEKQLNATNVEEKVKALKLSASKIDTKAVSAGAEKNHYLVMIEKSNKYYVSFWIETGSTITSTSTREDLYFALVDLADTHITGGTGSVIFGGTTYNVSSIYVKNDDDVYIQRDGVLAGTYAYMIYELDVSVKVISTDKAGSIMSLMNA